MDSFNENCDADITKYYSCNNTMEETQLEETCLVSAPDSGITSLNTSMHEDKDIRVRRDLYKALKQNQVEAAVQIIIDSGLSFVLDEELFGGFLLANVIDSHVEKDEDKELLKQIIHSGSTLNDNVGETGPGVVLKSTADSPILRDLPSLHLSPKEPENDPKPDSRDEESGSDGGNSAGGQNEPEPAPATRRFQGVGIDGLMCRLCLFRGSFPDWQSLDKHILSMHKPCDICNKYFRTTSNRNNHVETHTKNKPFECPRCGERFGRKFRMILHIDSLNCQLIRSLRDLGVDVGRGRGRGRRQRRKSDEVEQE